MRVRSNCFYLRLECLVALLREIKDISNCKLNDLLHNKQFKQLLTISCLFAFIVSNSFVILRYYNAKQQQELEFEHLIAQNKKIIEKFLYNDVIKLTKALETINSDCTFRTSHAKD